MAKEKKDEITFDKLADLNLPVTSNLGDVQSPQQAPLAPVRDKEGVKKPKKQEQVTIKTSFKIEKDLHLALKQYSLLEGEEMATIVFERILKPFLEKKGYYPPMKKQAAPPKA